MVFSPFGSKNLYYIKKRLFPQSPAAKVLSFKHSPALSRDMTNWVHAKACQLLPYCIIQYTFLAAFCQ